MSGAEAESVGIKMDGLVIDSCSPWRCYCCPTPAVAAPAAAAHAAADAHVAAPAAAPPAALAAAAHAAADAHVAAHVAAAPAALAAAALAAASVAAPAAAAPAAVSAATGKQAFHRVCGGVLEDEQRGFGSYTSLLTWNTREKCLVSSIDDQIYIIWSLYAAGSCRSGVCIGSLSILGLHIVFEGAPLPFVFWVVFSPFRALLGLVFSGVMHECWWNLMRQKREAKAMSNDKT